MTAAEHVAFKRDNGERNGRRNARGRFERFGDHGAAHDGLHGLWEWTANANHRAERDCSRRERNRR